MKKIAVCFTGRIKTWEYNLKNITENITESFGEVDWFASIHGESDDPYVQGFIKELNPVAYNVEKVNYVKRDTVWKEKMYSSLFHKWNVIRLVENHDTYDWVFIFRCDFTKVNPITLPVIPDDNTVYVPTPEIGNNVYIQNRTPDQINGGSMNTMKIFSELFLEIDTYITRGVPEDILYGYIREKGLSMKEFYWFTELDERRGGYYSLCYE